MFAVRVPSLAENVNQATIAKWLIHEGDTVEARQEIVEMLTEKAEFMLETDVGGTVTSILAPEKSVLLVGSILCLLDGTEEALKNAQQENRKLIQKISGMETVRDAVNRKDLQHLHREATRATPAARRLAKENSIDLTEVAEALHLKGAVKEEHVREFLDRG